MTWPAAIASHLNAGLPMRHEWALSALVKTYAATPVDVRKSLWTGDYDLTISLDGINRTYDGAMGGIQLAPIRYRAGTLIMTQEVQIALSTEGEDMVRGHNIKNAPCDIFCLCFDARDGTYLDARRFVKGFIDGVNIQTAEQGGVSTMTIKIKSVAKRGTMTTTGKKSHESQKQRDPADQFRKYSDLGRVASDPWGVMDD